MGINDYGNTDEGLNNPPLGGPGGWAAAVRDYITDLPAQIAGKLSKTSDDTASGYIRFSGTDVGKGTGFGDGWTGAKLRGIGNNRLAVRNWDDNANARLAVATPTEVDDAATKGYVDGRIIGGGLFPAQATNGLTVVTHNMGSQPVWAHVTQWASTVVDLTAQVGITNMTPTTLTIGVLVGGTPYNGAWNGYWVVGT